LDPDTDRLLPQIIHSFGILIRNSLHKQFSSSQELKLNPLDLADCDFVFGPVVKLGGPGQLMRSHLLGMLEPASVLQVNRHPGRAPGVTSDRCQKPRVPRSFANGCPSIVPIERAPAISILPPLAGIGELTIWGSEYEAF
jgi:hypothetical protein